MQVLNIAHRGASAYAPENTIAAFEKACELGADAIELDLRQTLDEQLVVFHDRRLDRTTSGRGHVASLTLSELKRLDVGGWFGKKFSGQRIQTLTEIFERFRQRVRFVIELKGGSDFHPGIEERLVTLIQIYGVVDQVLVHSFDHYAIKKIKELDPGIKTGAILMGRPLNLVGLADRQGFEALSLHHALVLKRDLELCRAANLEVYVWTVNEVDEMRRLVEARVTGIITDRPDLLRQAIASP